MWGKTSQKEDKRSDGFKTILIGDCNVGKTSIIRRYLHNQFTTQTNSTIGASFSCARRDEGDRYKKLDIWDTAGQERYRSIINIYYRGADVGIIVCDLTQPKTIEALEYWIDDMKARTNNQEAFILLVGNKVDLLAKQQGNESGLNGVKEPFPVPSQLQKIADKHGYPVVLTSALDGTNVDHIFETIYDNIDIPFGDVNRGIRAMGVDSNKKKRSFFSWCF